MNSVMEIMKQISSVSNFNNFTVYRLNTKLDMTDDQMQKLIYDLNQKINTKAYYNKHTKKCDNIGVFDKDGIRYYDFDDDVWTLTNKGIDGGTSQTKYN